MSKQSITPTLQPVFGYSDLLTLTDYVADAWTRGVDRDWSAQAGTLEWSCSTTADHAFDATLAIGFFLASRRQESYPTWGELFSVGPNATPEQLIEAIQVAGRLVAGVVATTPDDVTAIIHRNPSKTAPPQDFAPRAALELILHGHDVAAGLQVDFEPPGDACARLRDHTRDWRHWQGGVWAPLQFTDDPWGDIVGGSGRARFDSV